MAKGNPPVKGPQFVRYFGPVLESLRELGGSAKPSEVEARIAERLEISESEQDELTKSGQPRFRNLVAWARFYLVKAGLVTSSERGVWSLTETGQATHLTPETALALFRDVHAQFARERNRKSQSDIVGDGVPDGPNPPEPATSYTSYREELLALLKGLPPAGFEQVCQRLLRESGFEQVTVTGRSGDGGIDGHGVLQVNAFVSFRVLFQCKRYDNGSVSTRQVRDFRGAMTGHTDKGIILTTGAFTAEARREAIRDGAPPIELVDGEKLIDLFEQLQLGLRPVQTFALDHEFFEDFKH
jgi:restriction system protein